MASVNLKRPPHLDGSAASAERLRQYLCRLCDTLNYILTHLDGSNVQPGGLDRQIVQAARAEMGKAKIGAAQIQDLRAQVAKILTADIETLDVDWASIVSAELEKADIDFAKIKDLISDTQIITRGEAGELYIADLAVTEANMVRLSLGQLLLKGRDGRFYELAIDDAGQVVTRPANASGAIEDGTLAGEKLIDGSITARKLSVEEIFADSAVVRQLIAANLDTAVLFARKATIDQIMAMDILANERLKIYVDGQSALNDKIRAWFDFRDEGVLGIGRSDTAFSTTISYEELAFWYYTTKVAWMSGDQLHSPKVAVDENFVLGPVSGEVNGEYLVWT